MTREAIFETLNEVFQDVFDNDELTVDGNTTAADVEGWDSLMHVNLMVSVERAFSIKFGMGEIATMKNVGAMVDLITAKLA